jgi:hypothetical protein
MGMRQPTVLLALLLALPARAAVVVGESGVAAVPGMSAAAVGSMTPGLTTVLAPALSAPALLSMPAAVDRPSVAPVPVAAALPTLAAPISSPKERRVLPRVSLAGVPAPQRLELLFPYLDHAFPLPASSPAAEVRRRLREQLLSASRELEDPESHILETVAREGDRALARIQQRLDAHEIDPSRRIRLAESDAPVDQDSHARIGVYPVAADPFQWGHLLIALRAVGDLGVDKVVFVLAGDDARKPTMTPVITRHPMGLEVLSAFAPFFEYSPIAVGTTFDGETNIFRILALNPERRVDAWYMVGDDHYALVDKKGNPDTLPKLEANILKPMGHSPTLHALKVAFIKREHPGTVVPTDLEVRFLEHVGFDASSTQVRGGRHTLMPYSAYRFVQDEGLGRYGVPAKPVASDEPEDPDRN